MKTRTRSLHIRNKNQSVIGGFRMKKQHWILFFLIGIVLTGCGKKEVGEVSYENAVVHDPSIIKGEDAYYIFGSHLSVAKTQDFINWEKVASGVSNDNPVILDAKKEMKEAFQWAKTDTFWAPDVIQLKEDGKYYMYYCNCEGSSPLGCIGLAVADKVEGPYRNLGLLIKSGMTEEAAEDGSTYNSTYHPNAVDPNVFYDKEGKLWMMYGSYSGGIYILELDSKTGFPKEEGYGKKILGGNHLRVEAPYVIYNKETDYYYLFLSFGGLDADGGYSIRVCRSKTADGPYEDTTGTDMIECKGRTGSFFDDVKAAAYGAKIMGNYRFEENMGYLSPGHNSAILEEKSGNYYLIFHTRMEGTGEAHQVRVHQMYFNEDGWPVIAPFRYSGEDAGNYKKNEIAGEYRYINHGRAISKEVNESQIITLDEGNLSGAVEGTYQTGTNNQISITIGGTTYKGIAANGYDEFAQKETIIFTALSDGGEAIWGAKQSK